MTPEAPRLFHREAEGKTFRATTSKSQEDGSAFIVTYTVPGPAVHWFLFDVADEPGTVDEVLSVEVVEE